MFYTEGLFDVSDSAYCRGIYDMEEASLERY